MRDRRTTPTAVTDSSDVEPSRRSELYRSYFSDQLPFSVEVPDGDFKVRTEDWTLPGMIYSSSTIGAYKSRWNIHRKPSANIGNVMVRMLVAGEVNGFFDGEHVKIGPGDIYVMDFDCQALKIHADCRYETFYLSHAALETEPGRMPVFRHIPRKSPTARLMSASIGAFTDGLRAAPAEDVPPLTEALTRVFSALLAEDGRDHDQANLAESRRAAIVDFIRQVPGDKVIKAQDLCLRFNVSRATLYRMFADHGGVERFVSEQRLLAVYHDLARAPAARGIVREVAERWGFHDPAAFSRAFRARFEVTPSELLWSGPKDGHPGSNHPREIGPLDVFSQGLLSL